ncbi:MAG TPA: matrixin family metalloprotease, partial [Polyangiaceae bacterium]|nr:matrixin family metalloprotease [Polyangiaceae bacterium]
DELPEDKRQQLYRARKQHKLCSVFLHEVAHTLGVPHERSETSLMHARYDLKAHGFSEEAAELVGGALNLRTKQSSLFLDANFAQTLGSNMTQPSADWEAASRDQVLQVLADFGKSRSASARTGNHGSAPTATATQTTTYSPVAPQSVPAPSMAGLSSEEQRSYDRARAELTARHGLAAREAAAPLLEKHGDLPAVQSLRCDIAMSIGGDWDTISSECAGLSALGKVQ